MHQLTNADIKFVRSLNEKKFRDKHAMFVVEGEKMLEEALNSGYEMVSIWRRSEIGEQAMKRISQLSSPSPVLAILKQREQSIDIEPDGLYIALDGVRDPGNLGTIIRTADWFGVKGIFASPDTVELYNPKVIQSTMGSIFRCKLSYEDIYSVCKKFADKDLPVYGTFLDGKNIYSESLEAKGLIVMGNESRGVSENVSKLLKHRLLIPKSPQSGAESLNVASATAIVLSVFASRS